MAERIEKDEEQWRAELDPEKYRILREAGTEPAFTGKYYRNQETGIYHCGACGAELFSSDQKYESGSGWPSFWAPASGEALETRTDRSYGMTRVEVRCARCGSHLGHVFDDGPAPTGQRYCINSAALDFEQRGDDGAGS
ncbi:peptide-methionine (R)-S-oxide reductase MsrB [Thiohalomonas denitrificans]|uniref:Peptide methionine sulfoxide reductase MsrB n=1 Tax=Thiohalomonas denitrificans TaxID=415747 RepID=A0A1G5Q880_9GAMM|nr:peptide-methionine (R)-S-oxide reductase MsrB [Thiohalomonas denitrificans]SCZ57766.1 peptide-methionine (R)-S-oxide reductase [Thiohalomonas denitrificans]